MNKFDSFCDFVVEMGIIGGTIFLIAWAIAMFPCDVRCEQCDGLMTREPMIARWVSGWDDNHMHLECVPGYLEQHPIERDAAGNIITRR